MRKLHLAGISVTALAIAAPVTAQTVISSNPATAGPPTAEAPPADPSAQRTTTYDLSYFSAYAPRTALDVARRVPGFTLASGDSNVRGFGGAAGNVVINGVRPSSKSESLETTLSRIPARNVTRVEVGPGDLFGSDYAGKSQVLNVILSDVSGFNANLTTSGRRNYTGQITPNASGSLMYQSGPSTFNASAGTEQSFNDEEGTDTLVDPTTGKQLEFRRKFNRYEDREPYFSSSWALEQGSSESVRINARFSPDRFDLEQRNRVVPLSGSPRDDSLIQDHANPSFELGGDVTRPLAGGAFKLVGLATRKKRDQVDTYIQRDGLLEDGAQTVGGFEQTQKAKLNETIGRLSWSHPDLLGLSFEAGSEAVLNTLDSDVELFLLDAGGDRRRIDLPIDNATVREKRAEAFVNLGRSLSSSLRIDGGMTFEYSNLKVRGDALADRTLTFWKPNATIDWNPGSDWHTQFSVRRNVAQLNFYDFISAAELSNDRVSAGNENLVPQRAWEFRLTVDRPILGEGVAKIDLGHDLISKLQDRVLVLGESGQAFDAPGNIGTGKRYFAKATLDLPLGMVWNGFRAKLTGQLQRTRVKDPVSGEMRNFSDFFPDWEWSVDLRRDAGPLSYGMVVSDRDRFTFFRTDEFDTNFNGGPYGTAFVEYRLDPRTAITFDVDNLFNTSGQRERLIFSPNRAQAEIVRSELRERNRHLDFGLTLKRSFGGASGGGSGVAQAQSDS